MLIRRSFRSSCVLALFGIVWALPARAQTLEDSVHMQLDALNAKSSAYAKHLASGRVIAVRPDQPMNTLSVIKIPVMILAYRDAEAGRLKLDERYTIRPEDMRRGSGLLQRFAPGISPTYRDIITQMIITSDNSATDIMIHKVGLARVNEMLQSLGYKDTRLRMTTGDLFRGLWVQLDPKYASLTDREVFDRGAPSDSAAAARRFTFEGDSTKWLGRSTAREMTRMLEQIYNGELASKEHSQEMLTILGWQLYSSRLPQRISFRASVAHKTGDFPPFAGNDVGIIRYSGGPYIISVFTNQNRGSFFELEGTLGRIAEKLLNSWGGH
jgi:beta-lactamase class A